MRDDDFEWDDAKAAANLTKHGVSFEAARRAFNDIFGLERDDRREEYGEDRFTLIAMAGDRLLLVAYTVREQRFRVIMARYAEPFEKRLYHDQNKQT